MQNWDDNKLDWLAKVWNLLKGTCLDQFRPISLRNLVRWLSNKLRINCEINKQIDNKPMNTDTFHWWVHDTWRWSDFSIFWMVFWIMGWSPIIELNCLGLSPCYYRLWLLKSNWMTLLAWWFIKVKHQSLDSSWCWQTLPKATLLGL